MPAGEGAERERALIALDRLRGGDRAGIGRRDPCFGDGCQCGRYGHTPKDAPERRQEIGGHPFRGGSRLVSEQSGPPVSRQATQARRLEARACILENDAKITDSLAVANEAVTAWRAAANDDAHFIPELARCLGQFSMQLNEVGQFGGALDAAVESVRLWRTLADQNLELHGYGLFQAIMRLAPQAARLHFQEYFTLSEEGARLLYRLLPLDEARYLLPAAQACQRLADIGGMFGHPHKALCHAEMAVEFWRRLAGQDLIEHGPQLVRALKRLSIEQIDGQGRFGKTPLREARRAKRARLSLRLRLAIRI
jgi:hypothetical protein